MNHNDELQRFRDALNITPNHLRVTLNVKKLETAFSEALRRAEVRGFAQAEDSVAISVNKGEQIDEVWKRLQKTRIERFGAENLNG